MDPLVQQAYADGGVLDLDRAVEFFENQAGNVSTPDDRNVRRRLDDFLEEENQTELVVWTTTRSQIKKGKLGHLTLRPLKQRCEDKDAPHFLGLYDPAPP